MRSTLVRFLVAFGLAVSFVAVVDACSGTPAEVKSCADSCDGCCDGDTCVPLAKQAFATCGHDGAVCRACLPGQSCQSGKCLVDSNPPDAGPSDGGPPDAGPPDAGPTTCGGLDHPCCSDGCFAGLQCISGTCQKPQPPPTDGGTSDGGSGQTDAGTPGVVGSACASNGGCLSGDCEVPGFPGGYCTNACKLHIDCPSGAHCGTPGAGAPTLCLADCTGVGSQGTCRSGYVCDRYPSQGKEFPVCIPACKSDNSTCAEGTCDTATGFCSGAEGQKCHSSGAPCDSGLYCQPNGFCEPTPPDGGTGLPPTGSACEQNGDCAGDICIGQSGTSWPGGYCSQDCSTTSCDTGSECAAFGGNCSDSNATHVCLELCDWDGASGGCRAGYVCDRYTTCNGNASCITACNTDADCSAGTTCDTSDHFCCGGSLFRCCTSGTKCADGLSCGDDGYCH